ncbi:MAG: hypothetical protein PUP92_26185 [Rhizonema sp. PD38]|nr:hypothetical protein [Rhizonema sp. PD38]
MNTNESDHKGMVVCIYCRYNANPVGVKNCLKCGKQLVMTSLPASKKVGKIDTFAWGFLFLIAVSFLIFGAFGYYYGRELRPSTLGRNEKSSNSESYSDIQVYDSMKQVPNVPEGTFNYSGAMAFAPLTAHGTHQAINQAHPNFYLRYTPARNNNPGTWTAMSIETSGSKGGFSGEQTITVTIEAQSH